MFFSTLSANDLEFNTLQSDFRQIVTSKNKSITYSGHFIAHSRFGAFWHYKSPALKYVYFSKSNVTVLEPDLEQAVITDISDAPNLRTLLANAKEVSKDKYEASFDDTTYTLRVRNNMPAQINYTDKLGNKVVITLSNTRKNEPINEGLLEPKIPQNYDILTN